MLGPKALARGGDATMPTHTSPMQLSMGSLIRRAAKYHPNNEIVTLNANGPPLRKTHADIGREAHPLAHALTLAGVGVGDYVCTLMYNNYEHCLLYYTLANMGVCIAPLNRTERPAKLEYMLGMTNSTFLFVDECFLSIVKEMKKLPSNIHIIVCNTSPSFSPDQHASLHRSGSLLTPSLMSFSNFVGMGGERWAGRDFMWPTLHEDSALGVGFTSGSTGNPKGVIYSHKSSYVHLLMECSPDVWGISTLDCLLPLPPMFHCLGWLMPYVSFMTGCKLVLVNNVKPGADLVPVFIDEKVTFFCGVPAVLTAVRNSIEGDKAKTEALKASLRLVATGGTSPSPDLIAWFSRECGVELSQLWGMTEVNPVGTVGRHYGSRDDLLLTEEERFQNQVLCGYPVPTVELKVVDKNNMNKELPWDGKSAGVLLTRGPHVTESYLHHDGKNHFYLDEHGLKWLDTGDIAYITPKGQLQIVDRKKDVIKSGGEWISSKELENHLYRLSDKVAECCVIAIYNEKFSERPLAVIVLKPGATLTAEDVKKHFKDAGFRNFEIPSEIQFWDELPHVGSGKLSKIQVRDRIVKQGIKLPLSYTKKQEKTQAKL